MPQIIDVSAWWLDPPTPPAEPWLPVPCFKCDRSFPGLGSWAQHLMEHRK